MHHHRPLPPDVRDTLDLWVSDFLDRPAGQQAAAPMRGAAQETLVGLVSAACDERGPAALDEGSLAHAVLHHEAEKPAAELLAAFLCDLEDVGRLSGGRLLGAHVRALAAGRVDALRRPGSKLGRNDPCPCGSGRKFKQCCLKTLG